MKSNMDIKYTIFTSMLSSPSLAPDHPCAIPLNLAAADEPAGGGSGCIFVTSGTSKFILSTRLKMSFRKFRCSHIGNNYSGGDFLDYIFI